ncbi:MAG: hypothetical protein KQH53_18065 [Desulfarculaceae bacterium]|nr:hypothetical protein [Desulfarculaceae bacterium]
MKRGVIWLAILALALMAGGAARAAGNEPVGHLHEATKALADDIHAQRQAQGIPDQAQSKQALGSQKKVRFRLPMNAGKGKDTASAYCFGYTLNCTARVVGPANQYSGKVTTSEGSKVEFKNQKAGDPLDMTLHTGYFGDTTFSVIMEAGSEPWPGEAVVELVCSY